VTKEYIGSYGGCMKPATPDATADYITRMNPAGTSRQDFWQCGIDVSYNKWKGKYRRMSVGARGFFGKETATIAADYPKPVYAEATGNCQGIYAQVVYPIRNKIILEGIYADNFLPGDSRKQLFSVGIRYRFDKGKPQK